MIISNVYQIISNEAIKSISVHKATGPDKISATFLKDGAEILAVPMRHIINLSIEI